METPPQAVEERDYAYDDGQDLFISQNARPRRRTRRRGTMMSERQSFTIGNTTTEESASEDEEKVQRTPVVGPGHTREYSQFIESSRELEKILEAFTHTVQRLGSALGLSRASRDVRNELSAVRVFFEHTAQRLLGVLTKDIRTNKKVKHTKRKKRPRYQQRSLQSDELAQTYQNDISDALDRLAKALRIFSVAMNDFEDYSDRDGQMSLEKFIEQAQVLSGSLAYFGSDGDSAELRRFVYEKTMGMKMRLDEMAVALNRFIEVGVPCISYAQKRSNNMLLNAATVATFFAGVAATVLQFSIETNDSAVSVAGNALWFASLVLSIGSAVNGLLAMTWRQAVFSSPKRALPWYIRFWTRQGYLVLLVISVLAFLGGLLCYVFESQHPLSFWISAACTLFCVVGLASVSIWFGRERWSFAQFRKQMQLPVEVFDDEDEERPLWDWIKFRVYRLRVVVLRLGRSQELPTVNMSTQDIVSERMDSPVEAKSWRDRLSSALYALKRLPTALWTKTPQRRMSMAPSTGEGAISVKTQSTRSPGANQRSQSDLFARVSIRNTIDNALIEEFVQQLRTLYVKQANIQQSGDRVKHMQFSPNGRWLAVCYRYSCVLYKFEAQGRLVYHQNLRHTRRAAKQAEWSADGKRILTRMKDSVRLWRFDERQGIFRNEDTVSLGLTLKWIQWANKDEFLALSEDSILHKVNLRTGKILGRVLPRDLTFHEMYYFDRDIVLFIATHDIDVANDTYIDCIIVYNINTESTGTPSVSSDSLSFDFVWQGQGWIEKKIPLLHDVESLTVCQDRLHVLVSYEERPPEVWKYMYIPPKDEEEEVHTLTRIHELTVRDEDLAQMDDCEWGDAVFMGPSNEIVACPADDRVFFWNRTTRDLVHMLAVGDDDADDVPEFSWARQARLPFMASASGKTGAIKLWMIREREVQTSANLPNQRGMAPVSSLQTPLVEEPEQITQSPAEVHPESSGVTSGPVVGDVEMKTTG